MMKNQITLPMIRNYTLPMVCIAIFVVMPLILMGRGADQILIPIGRDPASRRTDIHVIQSRISGQTGIPLQNPSGPLTDTTLIFDDGSYESGVEMLGTSASWTGNYFPVPGSSSGFIRSFDVFFTNNTDGSIHALRIDVFNILTDIIGSSGSFENIAGHWTSVIVDSIPYNGPFYAMVKWTNGTAETNFLGYDDDGHYSSQDLEWFYDGTTWSHLSERQGYQKSVCMIRPHVTMYPNGISENNAGSEVLVYPNPARQSVVISSTQGITGITVTGLSGVVMMERKHERETSFRLDISSLNPGTYIMNIFMNERISRNKLIVLP
jgi:hypothetical protein